MSELRRTIQELSDKDLVRHYIDHKDEYTPEALIIMKEEIDKRGLDLSKPDAAPGEEAEDEPVAVSFKSDDFIKFDHSFSRTDLVIASAMLREESVPFFADNPTSTDTIPIEGESEKRYIINIPNTYVERVHAILDEHFIKSDNKYLLKYSGARERLKAFNFHDIHLTESESMEELEVVLSEEEKRIVVTLGRRLLGEADAVEKAQDRILFYFDSIEPFIEMLESSGTASLSKNDLLTMLEILQVYVDNPALPSSMDEAIIQILGLFIDP
jgi:hypothetical protein